MKIDLTISVNYLPTWGAFEGIREIIQNARDAEVAGFPMKITHHNQTLRIENEGVTLPHESLLLGFTTKAERSDMIGHFGEGYKIGALALVRAGRPLKIRSGSETWQPTIRKSDALGSDVLSFDISTGREPKNRVRVEIGGVTQSEWEEMKTRFLFIDKPKGEVIETCEGTLLLDPCYKGRLYVKGIFVQISPDFEHGYDLIDVNLDRDRKMVNSYDVKYASQKIWRHAVAAKGSNPKTMEAFYNMLSSSREDVSGINQYNVSYFQEAGVVDRVADRFQQEYGNDAVPVANLGESQEMEHLGRRGIVVGEAMRNLVSARTGNVDTLRKNLKEEAIKKYGWADLSPEEQSNLTANVKLIVDSGIPLTMSQVEVVDFRGEEFEGQYVNGQILIAKRHVADLHYSLEIMVHELGHRVGGDGSLAHENARDALWGKIAKYLRLHGEKKEATASGKAGFGLLEVD